MQKTSEPMIKANHLISGLLIIIIIFLAPVIISFFSPELFLPMETRVTDALFNLRYILKGKEETSPYAVHVVFDDSTITEYNVSLYNREIYGEIINILSDAGVSLIGYDIFFENKIDENTDTPLIDAVAKNKNVYLPLLAFKDTTKFKEIDSRVHALIKKNLIFVKGKNRGSAPEASFILTPYMELAENAKGLGHINYTPDPDGVVRWYPLLFKYGNGYIPSLTLRMICDYLRVDQKNIEFKRGSHIILHNAYLPGNILKDIKIPADSSGKVLVNFIAPYKKSFVNYSAKELLKAKNNKTLSARLYDELSNSMVIVSDISTRNKDFGPGVFDKLYPYSEIHMTVANMILTNNFLAKTNDFFILLVSILLAGFIVFFILRFKTIGFITASLLLFLLYGIMCITGFIFFSVIPSIIPVMIGFIGTIITGSLFKNFQAEQDKFFFQYKAENEKAVNNELRKLDELKNSLIQAITHELKNPLMMISAPIRLLYSQYREYNNEEVKEKISQAIHGVQRLHGLVDELLLSSKLQSRKERLYVEEVEMNGFIKNTSGYFKAAADKKNITIQVLQLPVKIKLFIDQAKMRKVISNLLSNAVKFTRPGGNIRVEISRPLLFKNHTYSWKNENPEPKHVVIISIADNGIGILKSEQENIFNLFYQVEDDKKPTFSGSGIGLYIVKEYTELHYGCVRIESTYGKGSDFKIILPTGNSHFTPDELSKANMTLPSFPVYREEEKKTRVFRNNKSNKEIQGKILIADDDDDVRFLIKDILSKTYLIYEAKNGSEGYKKAKEIHPDLILSDVVMPKVDGISFLKKIKNDDDLKNTPFILITAKTHIPADDPGLDADEYISKPCDPTELIKRVNTMITLKEQQSIINTYKKSHIRPLDANRKITAEDKPLFPLYPIFIIDVDDQLKSAYEYTLFKNGFTNIEFVKTCKTAVMKIKEKHPCLVLLHEGKGSMNFNLIMDVLKEEATQVIIITEQLNVDKAVSCIKKGAYDYLVTPVDTHRFITSVNKAIEKWELQNTVTLLSETVDTHNLIHNEYFSSIITRNEKMFNIFKRIDAYAPGTKPFLVTGETGVGKELIAQAIHKASCRQGPFIPVNVASLDDRLFSDTLFGHRKGAFTGADSDKQGLVHKAKSGTLFLDEIGDLGTVSQKKILRLLQENEYLPLGANEHLHCSARIIAATNADLRSLIKSGKFRKDVYERFTFKLHIPPLRDRLEDIPLLARHIIHKYAKQYGKQLNNPSSGLLRLLQRYQFPNNIRELENMIENAVLLCKSRELGLDSFKEYLEQHQDESAWKEISDNIFQYSGEFPTLDEMKGHLIQEALKRAGGKIGVASSLLGISRFSLSRWLKDEEK